jgi:outer membrane protein assembly factor BamD (BamD/ComL family)
MSFYKMKRLTLGLTALAIIASSLGGCVGAQQRWETAQSIDSIDAYRKILKSDPGTDYSRKAAKRIADIAAEQDWTAAEEAGTVAAYEGVVLNQPDSEYARRARARIAEIQEEKDWQQTMEKDEVSVYEAFLDNYPDSVHADAARSNVNRLRASTQWKRAQEIDTIGVYEAFLNAYPNSEFADQARDRIQALEASAAWQWTRNRDTPMAYQLFLEKYPDSEFRPEAIERIRSLEAEAEAERERQIEAARKRAFEANERAAAKIRKLIVDVESDCVLIYEFTKVMKRMRELNPIQFLELGKKINPTWKCNDPNCLLGLIDRLSRALSLVDKLIAASDGPPGYFRLSLDSPTGPLCREVLNELRRGNLEDDVMAAINKYRDQSDKNSRCFMQIMEKLYDSNGSFENLNACIHLH